jgi:hypothetical protein
MTTSKNYRCYFTDADDRIRSYEQIDCADDTAATLRVNELLATSQYNSAELWEGKRLVGKWTTHDGTSSQQESEARVGQRSA